MAYEVVDYKGLKIVEDPNGDAAQSINNNFKYIADNIGGRISNETEFHIATTGDDDTGNGSLESPWATLPHAMNELRKLRFVYPTSLKIHDGNYSIYEIVDISHIDGHLLTIEGANSYETTLTGASIPWVQGGPGWKRLDIFVNNTHSAASGNYVLLSDLTMGGINPRNVEVLAGCHRINTVDGNKFYIHIQSRGPNTPMGDPTGNVKILKSVLIFYSPSIRPYALSILNSNVTLKNFVTVTSNQWGISAPTFQENRLVNSCVKLENMGVYNAVLCENSNLEVVNSGIAQGVTAKEQSKVNLYKNSGGGEQGLNIFSNSKCYAENSNLNSRGALVDVNSSLYLKNCRLNNAFDEEDESYKGLTCTRGSKCFLDGGNFIGTNADSTIYCGEHSHVYVKNGANLHGRKSPSGDEGNFGYHIDKLSSLTLLTSTINYVDIGVNSEDWSRSRVQGITFNNVNTQYSPGVTAGDGSEIRSI